MVYKYSEKKTRRLWSNVMDRMESIIEALNDEIAEVKDDTVRRNIQYWSYRLYKCYEEKCISNAEMEALQRENEALREILKPYVKTLSRMDRLSIECKYEIEL